MSEPRSSSQPTLLEVRNLSKVYPVRSGVFQRVTGQIKAVDQVSFSINAGETLGLVGESGCGKTTVGHTLLRLIPATGGEVYFEDRDILQLAGNDLRQVRQQMQIVFQDPYAALDPRLPVGESIAEGLAIHHIGSPAERRQMTVDILKRVGLEEYHLNRFPHEFSGGQRQRIGIARALILKPRLIVLDEPVSALDVSVQAQVLNLLKDLQDEYGLTYLFIAHNLGVVEHISDRVAVMYLGKVVEIAGREELFQRPLHPYTRALMSAIPRPDPSVRNQRQILVGDVPSPLNPPAGCHFHPRCPIAQPECAQTEPELRELAHGHPAACLYAEKFL